jgi:glyoxylase-like metal-dependent hydrolase (beta-lactamase superfamily II)
MMRLTDAVWFTEPIGATDRPVLAIVKGAAASLMIDGGNCPHHAESFLQELGRVGLAAPGYVAVTHAHCDHIFGLSALTCVVLANRLTSERIRIMNTLSWNDAAVAERVAAGQEDEMTARMLQDEMPGDRTDLKIRQPDVVY